MEKYFLFSSLIERLDTVKLSVLPRLIYRYNAISVKITANYFVIIDKLIINFIWKGLRSRIANRLLKEKSSLNLMLPDFKTYYRHISEILQTLAIN